MDYMVQLAQSLLRLREKTRQELWVTVERCIGQSQADLDRWRSVDDAGRVELLADVLYRFPTDVAVLAAEAVGYPVFLKGLLERLVEFASEDTRPVRRTFNHLIHAHLVERDELKKALPADVADVISPLLRPPRTRLRRSLARVAALMAPLRRLFRRRSMPDAPVESESLDRGSIEKKALRLLLERPALVCRLAEVLQMAVPFSLVLARELDEIGASRIRRRQIDPYAIISDVDDRIAIARAARANEDGPTRSSDASATYASGISEEPRTSLEKTRPRLIEIAESVERGDERAAVTFAALVGGQPDGEPARPRAGDGGSPPGSQPPSDASRYSLRKALNLGLVGVAFSGGGIRSATVNLGVLQALASRNVLPQVDYLSTVSGGGYIGSWFWAWIKRQPRGVIDVQRRLSRHRSPDPDADAMRPIRFLREYSNYLTPRLGLLGADTWTMIATWTRNTVLNQAVLVLFLTAVLLIPRAVGGIARLPPDASILAALALFASACSAIGQNLRLIAPGGNTDSAAGQGRVQTRIVLPLFLAAVTLASAVARIIAPDLPLDTPTLPAPGDAFPNLLRRAFGIVSAPPAWGLRVAAAIQAALHACGASLSCMGAFGTAFMVIFVGLLVVQLRGAFGRCFAPTRHWAINAAAITFTEILSSATGALVVLISANAISKDPTPRLLWHAAVFGPPVLLLAFSAAGIAQVGLLGINFPDARREWVSRLGAWLLIYGVLWLVLFAGAIYGPYWLFEGGTMVSAAGGTTWIVTTIGGLIAGQRSKGVNAIGRWRNTLASAAMYVFVAGLLLLLAVGIHLAILRIAGFHGEWSFGRFEARYWEYVSTADWTDMLAVAALTFAAAFALGWRIDVNEFSMHHVYKNRLVRCYLGASRSERRPNPFTGFDERDDLRLSELRVDVPPGLQQAPYVGPYPLINTTLNLVKGDNLAWQERKAASFVFTPWYCGYEVPPLNDHGTPANVVPEAFRPTQQFAYASNLGVALGTAAAISGAAASPNQGYRSSPAAAFLMTMFNARLGWWIGNPRRGWKWRRSSPRYGLLYLLAELTGSTNDQSSFVNLSDGGHFDNLGLYELIRRRCRYILAFDAEQDGDLTFGALGDAVRKCRIDFEVDIDIQVQAIRHIGESKRSSLHYAEGTIAYPGGDTGILLYFKSSLTGDEPADVAQFATAWPEFPHQSTADQWFTESQFESYRELGEHMVDTLCRDATVPFLVSQSDVRVWFEALRARIREQTPDPRWRTRQSEYFCTSRSSSWRKA